MGTSQQTQIGTSGDSVASPRCIAIAILAMGGEGGGVLADWIVDLAESSGYLAQTTSVPGVAQRTGSTIYYVELFPEAAARAAGKDPVMALMPVPGEVDIVIASELMEAGRAITRGLVTPDRTTLITSTSRVFSMTEKIAMGDGRVNADEFIKAGQTMAKVFIQNDFAALAAANRSVVSATLFGALAGSAALPFERKQFEAAIERSGVAVKSSLEAFAAGVQAVTGPAIAEVPAAKPALKTAPALQPLAARISARFPESSHAVLLAGVQRMADYQDLAYAAEYLDRLEPVRVLNAGNGALLTETARYLALWMSYEDAIRVADLKTRRARFDRVHKEAGVDGEQLLQINEFLHPRVEEFADILPAGMGGWLLRTSWATRFVNWMNRNGKVLQTTSLSGFVQLYMVASLRPIRRRTLRFKKETQRISSWLAQVIATAKEDYALALEVAELPRLVKGYGDTYILGSRNYEALIAALPILRRTNNAAGRLKALREAAMADDTGKKLDEALKGLST